MVRTAFLSDGAAAGRVVWCGRNGCTPAATTWLPGGGPSCLHLCLSMWKRPSPGLNEE